MALAGKELRKVVRELFGPNTATGVIKYVDAAIIAGCMLTFFFSDCWCKASQMHR